MRSDEWFFIIFIVVIILLLVVVTAHVDVFFPTPSPVEFARKMVNATGRI